MSHEAAAHVEINAPGTLSSASPSSKSSSQIEPEGSGVFVGVDVGSGVTPAQLSVFIVAHRSV